MPRNLLEKKLGLLNETPTDPDLDFELYRGAKGGTGLNKYLKDQNLVTLLKMKKKLLLAALVKAQP